MIVPASIAAWATATSPSRWAMRWKATGAAMIGIEISVPSTVVCGGHLADVDEDARAKPPPVERLDVAPNRVLVPGASREVAERGLVERFLREPLVVPDVQRGGCLRLHQKRVLRGEPTFPPTRKRLRSGSRPALQKSRDPAREAGRRFVAYVVDLVIVLLLMTCGLLDPARDRAGGAVLGGRRERCPVRSPRRVAHPRRGRRAAGCRRSTTRSSPGTARTDLGQALARHPRFERRDGRADRLRPRARSLPDHRGLRLLPRSSLPRLPLAPLGRQEPDPARQGRQPSLVVRV